jgi:hypothetical protein
MLQVPIGRQEHFESSLFGSVEELAVLQRRPAAFVSSRDLVIRQSLAQRRRSPLIKQDTHSGRRQRASRRVLQDGTDLIDGDPREPLHKLGRESTILEVLEQRCYGNARPAEHPRSANSVRITLHGWAR